MQFSKKGLALAVLSAIVLSGCNGYKVDDLKADLKHAGQEIGDKLDHAGDKLGEAGHKLESSVRHEAQRAQDKLTLNVEKERLRQFGLDEADIDYVIKNSPDDAMAVAKNSDAILANIGFNYESSQTEITNSHIPNIQSTQWSPQDRAKVEKIWGRVAFVVNSPRFAKRFDEETASLDVRTFKGGTGDAGLVPADYQAFVDVASDALQKGNNSYKLEAFVNQNGLTSGGNAWGQLGQLEVFLNPEEIANAPVNQTAPLLLHEITHTFGYAHDGNPASNGGNAIDVTFVPNNIPYYVQLITSPGGMNQQYADLKELSDEIVKSGMTPYPSGANTDLFTQYFGS
ncbi:hypothetical protein JCM19241_347 [Vibrio ishigakensis]|uniref:Uncharacterized protein n=1 Tax=Vibrio ishigakensis TaxID=1481914 RepID=A0A0B8QNS7_9VIBR|nr:hypothetical protein JCM19241_347 [Vibrio ishigakensis]